MAAAEPDSFHNALSLQGFTGVLNTPSAYVTEEGWMYALYSDQKESQWRKKTPYQDNYLLSFGVFNFIELGGRFFKAPKIAKGDLSASLKLTSAPLTWNLPLVPVLAAGIQDLGGGNALLRTKYLVASEDIWRLRLSAGYGTGPDRMKGGFAGAELKAMDWLYFLGEYDTTETNLGARVILPQFWKVPVRFTATAKTSLNYRPGNIDIAVGFTLPLDFRMRQGERAVKSEEPTANFEAPAARVREPAAEAEELSAAKVIRGAPPAATAQFPVSGPAPGVESRNSILTQLHDSLNGVGFLNVRVGIRDRTLVVEYENTIFNHNELDALGLVAGLACEAAPDGFETLRVVIKRRNIRTAMISVPLQNLREFLKGPQGSQDLRDHLVFDFDSRQAQDADFLGGGQNSGFLNTSLILAPGLTTFIGTENAPFDYLLSLKPELSTLLWKGAVLNARWDVPFSWSSNFDDGKPYRSSRHPAEIERLMLFQALTPLPSVMLNFGAGMVLHDNYGMLNEAIWNPGDGVHRFRVLQGLTEDGATHQTSDLLLGSYRYYFSPLDVSLEGTAGKFWSQDVGYSVEMKRFWQDTALSLYFKDTKGTENKRWQAVGLQLSFPLTPRRDMKPLAKLQVRGSEEWAYAQETTLASKNVGKKAGNFLAPYPLAINPQPSQSLAPSFFNRDRLSAAYVLQHLDRLRESWLKYRASLQDL